MNKLNKLEDEAYKQGIEVQNADLPNTISGIYYNDGENPSLIALNSLLQTKAEQACVLAEELGHYYTSYGNILTDPSVNNTIVCQQESKAKRWAIKRLVSLKSVIKAYENGSKNFYEMAHYLDVTEEFLKDAFNKYNSMYGKFKIHGNYIVYFDPPGIFKNI